MGQQFSELTFQSIIEASPSALLVVNKDGKIIYVNRLMEKLFEYDRTELIGQSIEILIPDRFKKNHPGFRNAFMSLPSSREMGSGRELYACKKNHEEIPVEIGLNPLVTAEGTVVLASIINITERKKAEGIIKEQMNLLADKNKELERFAYISSHDLQEPLRTVLNYIQIIEEDFSGKLDKEVSGYLNTIKNASLRMQALIRALLDFSRLGRERQIATIDCNKIVQSVISDLNNMIKENKVEISVHPLPIIEGCEVELRMLFQNLISNSIKFRKKDQPSKIEIGSTNNTNYAEFYISDNGIGIDPKYAEKVFDMFQRLHSSDSYEGYGIGLANCKKIVELRGGKIWVESTANIGSKFLFTLKK